MGLTRRKKNFLEAIGSVDYRIGGLNFCVRVDGSLKKNSAALGEMGRIPYKRTQIVKI